MWKYPSSSRCFHPLLLMSDSVLLLCRCHQSFDYLHLPIWLWFVKMSPFWKGSAGSVLEITGEPSPPARPQWWKYDLKIPAIAFHFTLTPSYDSYPLWWLRHLWWSCTVSSMCSGFASKLHHTGLLQRSITTRDTISIHTRPQAN